MKPVSVSVVVPCYQCASTVVRAVESAIFQTVPALEIILVNDGSTDETGAALARLRDRFPGKVKVIEMVRNCGVSAARNRGWNAAVGDFIAFLDADDSWTPDKLEVQVAVMHAYPAAIMSGHRVRIKGRRFTYSKSEDKVIDRLRILVSNPFLTPSVMIRCNVPWRFDETIRVGEDYELWLQIVLRGGQAILINNSLGFVHKHPYGASGLSSNVWNMCRSCCRSFFKLARNELLSYPVATLASLIYVLKTLRKAAIVAAGKLGFMTAIDS